MTTGKPVNGLDPMPTRTAMLARLREKAAAGDPRAIAALAQMATDVVVQANPKTPAAPRFRFARVPDAHHPDEARSSLVAVVLPGVGERHGRTLALVLPFAPRTKKNHKTHYAAQSPAYRAFRAQVRGHFDAGVRAALGLPLPDGQYNIAATYYVDRRGERADRPGLDQGLFDALEDAGVIGDDWQFRTTDGTRIVPGDAHPRVELTITPID